MEFFLQIALIIGILLFILTINYKRIFKSKVKYLWIWIYFTSIFLLFLAGLAALNNNSIEQEYHSFDLNSDGYFSPEECTTEQQYAEMRYLGDGGRNLFTLFLLLTTPFIGVFCLVLFLIAEKIITDKRKKGKNKFV